MSSLKNELPWIHDAAKLAYKSLNQLNPDMIWDLKVIQTWIHDSYSMSEQDRIRIYKTPQRTPEWFKFRDGHLQIQGQPIPNDESDSNQIADKTITRAPIITSSIAGRILGHEDGYKRDRAKIAKEMLWSELKPTFTPMVQAMLDRGTASESITMEYTVMHLMEMYKSKYPNIQIGITEVGLVVDRQYPFMAASPDGIIHFYDPDTNTYWQSGLEMKARGTPWLQPYPTIPHKYFDQIQHAMAIIGLKDYHFVCYANGCIQFEVYKFDHNQWKESMKSFQKFYWITLWPAAVLKAHGWLKCPELRPDVEVTCKSLLQIDSCRKAFDEWKNKHHSKLTVDDDDVSLDCPTKKIKTDADDENDMIL